MNLRDKLSRLDALHGKHKPPSDAAGENPPIDAWIDDMQHELDIKVLREAGSFILLKENYYPIFRDEDYLALREGGFAVPALGRLTADLPAATTLRDALFIDTETTGLAGGTGTYPFLIGAGHVELDHIVVRQYLLPEFTHEWLMLKHIDNLLNGYAYTVSFNGKSFDLPLLRTRFVLNRQDSCLDDMQHVDVLHPARRIWRERLPSCDLQTLEKFILDVHRVGDVPGNLVPHLYFEFIRKRDALLLRDVLEHNFHDIVNMILLTMRMARICEAPLQHLRHRRDIYSLGRYWFQQRDYSGAIPLLEWLAENDDGGRHDVTTASAFLLSLSYKKSGEKDLARDCLQTMVDGQTLKPEIIEELAKVLEHDDKDIAAALAVVEKGLQYLDVIRQLDPRSKMLKYVQALQHRHARLVKRLAKAAAEGGQATDA